MRKFLERKKYKLYSFYFHDYEKFNTDFRIAERNCKNFGDYLNPVEIKFKDFQDKSINSAHLLLQVQNSLKFPRSIH